MFTGIVLLILATFAVARITRLLTEDRITVGYRRWVIGKWGEDSLAAYLVHCPWCTSIYIAAAVMPLSVWAAFHAAGTAPWYITTGSALLSIPAASHVAGMLNRE